MPDPEITTKRREIKRLAEARRRQQHRANGLCLTCSNPNEGKSTCPACSKRATSRKNASMAKSRGTHCAACKIPLERNSRRLRCPPCLSRIRSTQAISKRLRKARGLCVQCGKLPHVANRSSCSPCLRLAIERIVVMKRDRITKGLCYRCGQNELINTARYKSTRRVCEICYFRIKANGLLGKESLWRTLRAQLESQNGKCPYTGEIIVLGVNDSVDHILPRARFPELARQPSNLEWVTYRVNLAKRDMTRDEFLNLVSKIQLHTRHTRQESHAG